MKTIINYLLSFVLAFFSFNLKSQSKEFSSNEECLKVNYFFWCYDEITKLKNDEIYYDLDKAISNHNKVKALVIDDLSVRDLAPLLEKLDVLKQLKFLALFTCSPIPSDTSIIGETCITTSILDYNVKFCTGSSNCIKDRKILKNNYNSLSNSIPKLKRLKYILFEGRDSVLWEKILTLKKLKSLFKYSIPDNDNFKTEKEDLSNLCRLKKLKTLGLFEFIPLYEYGFEVSSFPKGVRLKRLSSLYTNISLPSENSFKNLEVLDATQIEFPISNLTKLKRLYYAGTLPFDTIVFKKLSKRINYFSFYSMYFRDIYDINNIGIRNSKIKTLIVSIPSIGYKYKFDSKYEKEYEDKLFSNLFGNSSLRNIYIHLTGWGFDSTYAIGNMHKSYKLENLYISPNDTAVSIPPLFVQFPFVKSFMVFPPLTPHMKSKPGILLQNSNWIDSIKNPIDLGLLNIKYDNDIAEKIIHNGKNIKRLYIDSSFFVNFKAKYNCQSDLKSIVVITQSNQNNLLIDSLENCNGNIRFITNDQFYFNLFENEDSPYFDRERKLKTKFYNRNSYRYFQVCP